MPQRDESKPDSRERDAERSRGLVEIGAAGVLRITTEAWKNAPPGMKAALYAPAIMGFLGAIVIGGLFLTFGKEHPWLIVLAFVLTGAFVYIPHWKPLRFDPSVVVDQRGHSSPPTDDSARSLVAERGAAGQAGSSPLDEQSAANIRAALCAMCVEAATIIRNKSTGMAAIADDRVRANIFLPREGQLRIDRRLAVNMNHPPEPDMHLRMDQGATGLCYTTGRYGLTRRLSVDAAGLWDARFQMTPELNLMLHRDLKWIYSFPIRSRDSDEVLGVLNIDGLVDVPDDEVLHQMASQMLEAVSDIGDHIDSLRATGGREV